MPNFFEYCDMQKMVEEILEQLKNVRECATNIYNSLKEAEDQTDELTVHHMLKGLKKNEYDVTDELAKTLFARSKNQTSDDPVVNKEDFVNWWSEGKLDHFEIIKYYLIDMLYQNIGTKFKETDIKTF